jgi:folate-binding protein YgfZ
VTGATRIDRSGLARLVVRGADRRDFLNRMATSDLAALRTGQGAPAFFLERTGRVIDRVVALDRGEDLLLIGSAGRAGALAEWLTKYVIADDVEVTDVTAVTMHVTVLGAAAAEVLEAKLGVKAAGLARWEHCPAPAFPGATIVRAEYVGGRSFHVIAPAPARAALDAALAALPWLDEDAYRAQRVEAGVPEWGAEFGDRTIPLEMRQTEAISFTKGCYVGQEVVARLHNHKRVKRSLVRMRVSGGATPSPDAVILDADRDVGHLTSVAPFAADLLALGYVDVGLEAPGRHLTLRDGASVRDVEILTLTPQGDPA